MRSAAFRYVGSFWGVLPMCLTAAVAIVCGRIFNPDMVPLWLGITAPIFFLFLASLPVVSYLQARRWQRQGKQL